MITTSSNATITYTHFRPTRPVMKEPTPIYDELKAAFKNMRRSSRPGAKCMWIEAYPGAGYDKCLGCGDIDLSFEVEDD